VVDGGVPGEEASEGGLAGAVGRLEQQVLGEGAVDVLLDLRVGWGGVGWGGVGWGGVGLRAEQSRTEQSSAVQSRAE
jgi:hypothetical protein